MEKIYIRMFGGFEVFHNGELISLGRMKSNKTLKLLQILLLQGSSGISRKELTEYLFQDEEIQDAANSLRVHKHRLQDRMVKAGLPKQPYIIIKKNVYYWNSEVSVETDVDLFHALLKEAQETEDASLKAELLYKACSYYKGELLEEVGAEEWVLVRAIQMKQEYEEAVSNLVELFRESKQYESMLEVSSNAARIYPYDAWQLIQIESLMAMRRKQEAMDIYNKMAQIYFEDLMIRLPEEITSQLRDFKPRQRDINEIERNIFYGLREMNNNPGAINLSFASFVDALCVLKRVADEKKRRLYITAYVLKDEDSSANNIQDISESLAHVLKRHMRNVDIYTNVNQSQYLVLTSETTQEECEMIAVRVKGRFRDKCGKWTGDLRSYVIPVENDITERAGISNYMKILKDND